MIHFFIEFLEIGVAKMKKWIFGFICIILFALPLCAAEKKVCLNMIVKNESKVIKRSLGSVKPIIDYWVIVDTGSTDGTQKIIREFMKDIPGELHERPWVDFAHNRNEALDLARDKGDYVFFIDADEELIYEPDFSLPELTLDSYDVAIDHSGSSYFRKLLIKNEPYWKWVGVLHEYIDGPGAKTQGVLSGVVNLYRSEGCRSQDVNKFEKDVAVLEKALLKEPDNGRYVFYLAQSYKDAGNYERAVENYQKRAEMGGWDQEVYWCKYQIAVLQQCLGRDAATVIKSYSDAIQFRPGRVEAYSKLATYFRESGNYVLGYLVATEALAKPRTTDSLFIEEWHSDHWLLFEQSICAYWVGEYEKSLKGSLKLKSNPNLPDYLVEYVDENLKWAKSKLPGKH